MLTKKNNELDSYRGKLNRIKQRAEDQAFQMQKLISQTSGINRISISEKVNVIQSKVAEIDAQCKKIEEALQALKLTILEQAQVVGTTLAKTCMSLSDLGVFDNVIIDEASMASLLIKSRRFWTSISTGNPWVSHPPFRSTRKPSIAFHRHTRSL